MCSEKVYDDNNNNNKNPEKLVCASIYFVVFNFFLQWLIIFLKNIFYWLCYYSCPIFFFPLFPSALYPPPSFPHLSSRPWVLHISSLASPFPILFLTSPCLFSTNHLCYLFSVHFLPLSPSQSPIDNPPCDLHLYGSVPVLVVCLVCFCFYFRCGC